ncbi:liprin-beta-1 isoform X6 [Sander lucioperca]|uniref:liprin-beta-1 isoform X6 n=1 Tax=Sander lucioperca TaxID=283035 RepID=UPI001653B060|nr:liprin-beta-1 isoform X6 [Sander lucioperca]
MKFVPFQLSSFGCANYKLTQASITQVTGKRRQHDMSYWRYSCKFTAGFCNQIGGCIRLDGGGVLTLPATIRGSVEVWVKDTNLDSQSLLLFPATARFIEHKMMSDASDMLAAALEQMDGIIAGSKAMDYSNGLFDCQSPTSPFLGGLRVLHLLEDLRGVLELMDNEERDNLRCQIPDSTAEGLAEWLQGRLTNGHGSEAVYQERLSRLESDKECLILQVSVLTDQVEVQGEKIRDLDNCLDHHREKLNATEELLQQELLNRTTLETQKLELMTEVSSLKLKLTAHRDNEGLYQEVTDLRFRVTDIENERLQCEKKLKATKEELQFLQQQLEEREVELTRLKDESRLRVESHNRAEGGERDSEVLKMKMALESLASANDVKEQRIKELEESLTKCKKVQQLVKEKLEENDYDDIPEDPSASVSMEMDQVTLVFEGEAGRNSGESIPCIAVLSEMNDLDRERQLQAAKSSLDVPQPGSSAISSISDQAKKNAGPGSSSPTRANTTSDDSFGSKKARSSFGRGFFKLRGGKQTASSPNLAETERKGTEHLDLAGVPPQKSHDGAPLPSSPETKKKSKGFMKFFGRLKRSHSTSFNLDDAAEMEFRRGGVRATAGPRLGWSRETKHNAVDVPFSQWSKDEVCAWLHEQGLGLYVAQGQSWIKSGQTLLRASQHDLEKELCIKQPLHRKKLQLALQALGSEEDDLKGRLDSNWVTRWLDDIGLPQYKSHFDEARVDGRVLHYMTVEDLLSLKVGSVLHHLSIKRAIQVLRLNCYEPNCLRRRPSDENNMTPAEISQWTNHRVMEWLRSVDLAEYAPNLRGSGVHGGLMVLEPRFNVEALALLLNIPPNKTLLRRHLATHFHLLIGSEAQRLKQDCLENPDYTVLTATARVKVKPRRLSFGGFGTLRKKRQDDGEDYICPMNVEMPKSSSFHKGLQIYEEHLDHLEQMEDSEGTVRQIGAFSEEINNLTIMLKEDEFCHEISVDAAETDHNSSV